MSETDQFTLIKVLNPFDSSSRTTEVLPVTGKPLAELFSGPLEYIVSINGQVLPQEALAITVPKAGDYVVLCPALRGGGGGGGGKNPLVTIAAVALTVVTFGGAGVFAGGLLAGGATTWLAAGALLYLGGMLLSGMSKAPKVEMPDFGGSAWEGGHGWGDMRPMARQGGTVPITYGTVRTSGTVLGQHVSSDGQHQYLNLLLSGGEGPITSISHIRINGNPIEHYNDTSEETLDQTVNLALSTAAQQVTTSAGTVGFVAQIRFPNGLFGLNLQTRATVTVRCRYSRDLATWTWAPNLVVTAAQNTAFVRQIAVTGLAPETWHIQMWTLEAPPRPATWTVLTATTRAQSVSVETRLGTNNQTMIPFFGDTYADQHLQMELTTEGFSEFQTEGDAGRGIEITLTFPQGLAFINDDGSAGETWVRVTADFRVGGGVWTSWLNQYEIRGAVNRPLRRTFRRDNVPVGRHEVRCMLHSVHGETPRHVNVCIWSQLTHIVYDDFTRPGKALVSMRALATDKISGGMPSISWLQRRDTVLVFNPAGGAYVTRSATNPAWICYDLIHRAKSLRNVQTGADQVVAFGEPHTRINHAAFDAWATWCSHIVDGEPRCRADILMDAADGLWDQLQRVAQIGRGMVVLRGTQFDCVFDGATATPVQMFTVGNIVTDSLGGEYLSGRDRADAVEISFLNEAKDYQRDTVIVYGDGFDGSTSVATPTQVFLPGVTSYRRAYREGLYRLRLNRYIRRAINFQADIDAIACQVGDVVLVQHDVPRWGIGGRLAGATTTHVTLDKEVTLTPGVVHIIMVRLANDAIVERTIAAVTVETVTATVEVTVPFSPAPSAYDVYALGEQGKATKPFRVTKLARSGRLQARIEATEYYPEIYDETAAVPVIDYTVPLDSVTALQIEFRLDEAGRGFLDFSWSPPRDSYGGALIMVDSVEVGRVGPTSTRYSHRVVDNRTYIVQVFGLNAVGHTLAPATQAFTVSALGIPAVIWGTLAEADSYALADGNVATDIVATFEVPDYRLFKAVRLFYQVAGAGLWIRAGETTSGTFTLRNLKVPHGVTVRLDARIINRWNVEGPSSLSPILTVQARFAPPAAATNLTLVSGVEILKDGVASVFIDGSYTAGMGTLYVDVAVGTGPAPTDWRTVTQSTSGTFRIRGLAHATLYSVRLIPHNNAGAGPSLTATHTTTEDTSPPSVPGAPTLTLLFKSIRVRCWQGAVLAPDLAGFRILRNTTNTPETAVVVGFQPCAGHENGVVFLDDTTDFGVTYFYWLRAVDRTGNISGMSPSAGPITTTRIVGTELVSGTVGTLQISDSAITAAKTCIVAICPANGCLVPNSVGTVQISDSAITAPKICANAVTSAHICANAVVAAAICAGAVTAGKFAACAVAAGDIASNAVAARHICADAVTTGALSVLARSHVNPFSSSGHLRGWGNFREDGSGSSATVSFFATDRAMRVVTSGLFAVRSQTWLIDHNKIYRVAGSIRKNVATGRIYIGVAGFTSPQEGFELHDHNAQGDQNFTPFDVNRNALDAMANFYWSWTGADASPTAYTPFVYYLLGANRSIGDVPHFVGGLPHVLPFVRASSSANHVAIRFLNWYNGATVTTMDVANVSVTDIDSGQIVAQNILAGAVTSEKILAGAITADKICAGTISTDHITMGPLIGKDLRTAAGAGDGTVSGIRFSPTGLEAWCGAARLLNIRACDGDVSLCGCLAFRGGSIFRHDGASRFITAHGNSNIFLGHNTGNTSLSGTHNIAAGLDAMLGITTGFSNFAVGTGALQCNSTGCNNYAIGITALVANTAGSHNLAIGTDALRNNTVNCNIGIGTHALRSNTTGVWNLAIGADALCANTTGTNNLAIGAGALRCNTAVVNFAIGDWALCSNTTGAHNFAMGTHSMTNNTGGNCNLAIGPNTLQFNVTGHNNLAIGFLALHNNTNSDNLAIGSLALCINTGWNNFAIGFAALRHNTTGVHNLALGLCALGNATLGNNNVGVGSHSLAGISTGHYNIGLGVSAGAGGGAQTHCNTISIGTTFWVGTSNCSFMVPNCSNRIYWGNRCHTHIFANVTAITAMSDISTKCCVSTIQNGLDIVRGLAPVCYRRHGMDHKLHMGFIAQDVARLLPTSAYDITTCGGNFLGLRYTDIIAPTVAAVQRLDQCLQALCRCLDSVVCCLSAFKKE